MMLHLTLPLAAVKGKFSDRIVTYSTAVPATDITSLLGHDPRPKEWGRLPPELKELYEYIQRKPDKSRRELIAGYIEERFGERPITIGAFPAISVAFQDAVQFEPTDPKRPEIGSAQLPISRSTVRILIDGLGRVAGALELEGEGGDKVDLLKRFTFPVIIYAPSPEDPRPLSATEIAQLFHDFNFRVRPVSKAHAMALDSSDLYIALATKLGEQAVFTRHGGVAVRVRSLGSKSTELVTQQNLVRCIRGGCEGAAFQISNVETVANPNLTRDSFGAFLDSFREFFEGLEETMGADQFGDRSCLHLSAIGWQAIGVIHHDVVVRCKLDTLARQQVIRKLGRIDWSRYNSDWIGLVGNSDSNVPVDSRGRHAVRIGASRRQDVEKMFNYLRQQTGLPMPKQELETGHQEAA